MSRQHFRHRRRYTDFLSFLAITSCSIPPSTRFVSADGNTATCEELISTPGGEAEASMILPEQCQQRQEGIGVGNGNEQENSTETMASTSSSSTTTTTASTTTNTKIGFASALQHDNKKKSNFFDRFHNEKEETCGVFLAPSTIPGAGLGMFAGKSYNQDEVVTNGDIVIPLPEIDWHNGFQLDFFLWEEYTWSAASFSSMAEEIDYNSMQGCSTGIGAALNCMLPLVNLVDDWAKVDSAGLHRSKDPGAGAVTIWHDRKGIATRNIFAGEELFIDYGENYFESREETYGKMPLSADYEEADELLARYADFVEDLLKHNDEEESNIGTERRDELLTDLYHLIKTFPIESRVVNALPEKHTDIGHILNIGTAEQYHTRSIRDLDWLNENGKCMDNVHPGLSTMPQAGRGIFASRPISEGAVVMPAPLIHINDKEDLRMYEVLPEDEEGFVGRDTSKPMHYQLLLNYCFGHRDSKILLSPYGMFNGLANHNRERANTRIVWSDYMRSPQWIKQPPRLWTGEHHSGLAFDFVATRDIEPDEEIFIDYGDEWEQAWQEHVRNWKPPPGSTKYVPAYQLEEDVDLIVRTQDEGGYGPNVKVFCRNEFLPFSGLKERKTDFLHCRAVKRYTLPGASEPLYIVEILRHRETKRQTFEMVAHVLFGVPRDVFHFVDEPYTRDHQMPWSFRHEIMIPDDMFPEEWKNINEDRPKHENREVAAEDNVDDEVVDEEHYEEDYNEEDYNEEDYNEEDYNEEDYNEEDYNEEYEEEYEEEYDEEYDDEEYDEEGEHW